MKYKFPLLFSVIVCLVIISGCSGKVNNGIYITNYSMGTIFFNFRGSVITAAAGSKASITEIPKGSYQYSTTYVLPAGTLSTSAPQGAVSGTVTVVAGTRISIIYSSTLINGAYQLSATISSSDPITTSP